MFNARAFATGRSAFHFKGCGEFLLIALAICGGQIAIVQIVGAINPDFFNAVPLSFIDWVIIIASTSFVLWLGELARLLRRK